MSCNEVNAEERARGGINTGYVNYFVFVFTSFTLVAEAVAVVVVLVNAVAASGDYEDVKQCLSVLMCSYFAYSLISCYTNRVAPTAET